MTNNPTIDGVSRKDLDLVLTYGCGTYASDEAWDRLRALLDAPSCKTCQDNGYVGHMLDMHPCPDCAALAPSVERQEAFAATDRIESSEEDLAMNASPWSPSAERSGAFVKGWMVKAKLAQSTIAQLEDKPNKAIDLDFQRRETIARLEARVRELESGRGESVCEVIDGERGARTLLWFPEQLPNIGTKLYADPPAPVAVVLPPEDDGVYDYGGYNEGHKHGWNECLDATAALNEKPKQ